MAVVGGGIAGASTAYQLARVGAEVVLVDPAVPGSATGAGAGIITAVTAATRPAAHTAFALAAVRHYPALVAELEQRGHLDHGYGVTGQLIIATDDAERAELPELLARARELGTRGGTAGVGTPALLDGPAAVSRCPILAPVAGALWLPQVARVDGRRLRDRLREAARDQGAALVTQPATLRRRGGQVEVATADGPVGAEVVVLAAGAWSADLAAAIDLPLPVFPQRGQIVHARLPGCGNVPVVTGFHSHYLLSFPGDRIVFGATREPDAGFDYAVTVSGLAETIAEATRVAPALAAARWEETRVGFRPASRDGVPLLGRPAGFANLVVGTGFGPQGLTLGPYAGSLLARMALGEPVDLPPDFHPDRFR